RPHGRADDARKKARSLSFIGPRYADEIERFAGLLHVAFHFHEGEGPSARLAAQRLGKVDLVLSREAGGMHIGRAATLDEPLRQQINQEGAVFGPGIHNLDQSRVTERNDSEKTITKGGARLALKSRRVARPKHEGTRDRPLSRLGGALEDKRVRRIEPDGAQQLHV